MTKAVVIGGGVAGLATTALLLKEGYEVHLVEQNTELGGRAGTLEVDGFRWDTGPSWYLMPDAFEHFFQLCGTSVEEQLDLKPLSPAYRIIDEHGECLDVHSDIDTMAELLNPANPVPAQLSGHTSHPPPRCTTWPSTAFCTPTSLISSLT